ncbi:MAG: DAK2 domain-containing protein [Ilumatobacter fluminis]|uniref:DAK2 domain-containing protein n=1 Tax=Ilumatobacter fluminis TaxID=467091 RepID=UPI0032EB12D4
MTTLERLDVHALRSVITTFRDAVRDHAGGLNRLNVYPVPDGDTGTNMARTLEAVVAEMETADPDSLDATCDAISHGSLMGARGNSGVILSQILRGLASTLKDKTEGTGERVADALAAASVGAYQAVLKPIEGTILTVVRESADAAKSASADDASLVDVLRAAREAGRQALASTPDLLPVLKDAGVVDAGGAGYLLLLDSALHVVDGEPLPAPEDDPDGPTADQLEQVAHRAAAHDGEIDVSEQRYEVMYFLDLADERIDEFKSGWGAIGDSIVVVGGDGLWNCHVHTNDIGAAIEVALDLDGRPKQIRVTDLFEEVDDEHARREAELHGDVHVGTRAGAGLPPVTTAVVAVCSGDGLAELFSNLGVQGIVTGGQTLNPSTAELLDTVEHVNADQVVILPNNKNIIPVAEQVDALSSKRVSVVPTRTMPEALAALVVYDPEADADDNVTEMNDSVDAVRTGEVTQAVRSTNSDAGPIAEGDWMGIVKGDGIVAVDTELLLVVQQLLGQLIADDGELLTIITGVDADPAVTELIESWLADRHPDVQVEIHRGGQPLYPYLFGVE